MGCTLMVCRLNIGEMMSVIGGCPAQHSSVPAGARGCCARVGGGHGVRDVLQVRVLELENQLQKERQKLGELRKKHYELAGVAEGWEEDGEWIPVLLRLGRCTGQEWGRKDGEALTAVQATRSSWHKQSLGTVVTCEQSHGAPDLCKSLWHPHRPWAAGALLPCEALESRGGWGGGALGGTALLCAS